MFKTRISQLFEWLWYQPKANGLNLLFAPVLWPLSRLFQWLAHKKRNRHLRAPTHAYTAPVIVVGNISVGGTGKTPFITWLACELEKAQLKVGIVSRGYGANVTQWPHSVSGEDSPELVGDEPKLLHQRLNVPVVIHPKRDSAVKYLLEQYDVDVVLSDDGMQHYAMHRDLEIALIDGTRGLGNAKLLPAGPLREPESRLASVDYIVCSVAQWRDAQLMQYEMDEILSVQRNRGASHPISRLAELKGQTVHGVAGVGNPQRFFDALKAQGVTVIPHAFSDHHQYKEADLAFDDDLPVLMTEKDAVKCRKFLSNKLWYLPVKAQLPSAFQFELITRIKALAATHAIDTQANIKPN